MTATVWPDPRVSGQTSCKLESFSGSSPVRSGAGPFVPEMHGPCCSVRCGGAGDPGLGSVDMSTAGGATAAAIGALQNTVTASALEPASRTAFTVPVLIADSLP